MELGIAVVGVILALVATLFARAQIRIAKRQLELSRIDAHKIMIDIVTGYFSAARDTINAIEDLLNILKQFTLPRDFLNSKVHKYIDDALVGAVKELNHSEEKYQAVINANLEGSGSGSLQEIREHMVELVKRIQLSLTGWGFWNIVSKVYDSSAFDSDFAELVRMFENITQDDRK